MLRKRSAVFFAAAIVLSGFSRDVSAQEFFGTFHGDLITKALDDGRRLELTNPFSFSDPTGKLWSVPVGTVVDGASIPRIFFSVVGGPFDDKYRDASVIHDHFCDKKTEPWEKVHLVFYNGMRAKGVDSIKAKLMYAAVYNFGPKWVQVSPDEPSKLISGQPVLLNDAKEAVAKFILENDPSIEDINEISRRLTEARTIEQLEKILFENGNCTPILQNPGTDGAVGKTLILCGMSVASKRRAAIKNLRLLNQQLGKLLGTQMAFMLPAIDDYIRAPDAAKWENVKTWSLNVHGLIKLGVASVLKVEDARAQELAPPVADVFDILSQRAAMISPILEGPPKSREEMQRWVSQYRVLVDRLQRRLLGLEQYLSSISQ
jgi:hypothetical protein